MRASRPPTICWKSSSATANGMTTARASSCCSFLRPGAAMTRPLWFVASACRPCCSHNITSRFDQGSYRMAINSEYRGPGDLPETIPVFPLPGALLLPRGQMPLNVFEPRYLEMVDDSFRDGHRLLGKIKPDIEHSQKHS